MTGECCDGRSTWPCPVCGRSEYAPPARGTHRSLPRSAPSSVVAGVRDALQRAREAAPADRVLSWRLHDALDEAEGCLPEIDAELDRLADLLTDRRCGECAGDLDDEEGG